MAYFDVSIVGASVIGGVAARECARRGLTVALIDEDRTVGKNHRCTAIYSSSGLYSTGINFHPAIVNKINGAVIHAPNSNCSLTVESKDTFAYVLDRQRFDELSVEQAIREGAELFLDNRVIGFDNGPCSKDRSFNSKIIIGADGARSFTAQHFRFPPMKNFVHCYETEMTDIAVSSRRLVDVFIDNRMFPGFFGWVVPTSSRSARFGFGVSDPMVLPGAKERFFSKKEIKDAIEGGSKVREFYAPIPASQRPQTQKGNVLLVGDAAGHVKATTGGGVVFGSMCARVAAKSVADHLLGNKKLNYEHEWRVRYGHTLTVHSLLRFLMDNTDSRIADLSIGAANLFGFNRFLESFGDMDFVLKPLTVKI
jgi:geranylgeranyl reductase family protein